MTNKAPRTCPSTAGMPGARLLGVVGEDGHVGYVSPTIQIDEAIIERLGSTELEKRFRFSGPCVEGHCPNWSGSRCRVIDEFVSEVGPSTEALPHCGIRGTCRWFSQVGPEACFRCPVLVTDTRNLSLSVKH
jgi:hypothetical protein